MANQSTGTIIVPAKNNAVAMHQPEQPTEPTVAYIAVDRDVTTIGQLRGYPGDLPLCVTLKRHPGTGRIVHRHQAVGQVVLIANREHSLIGFHLLTGKIAPGIIVKAQHLTMLLDGA